MPFPELPGSQQSGLEDRGCSKHLQIAISRVADLLSQTGQTKNRFNRLYISSKYPDTV